MSFGRKLKMIRLEHNLDQKAMSEILFISPTVLSRYETGEKLVTENSPIVKAVAEHFKKDIAWLLEDEVKNKTVFENGSIGSGTGIGQIETYNINVPKDMMDIFLNMQKMTLEILHMLAKNKE
jgi:transcriptional regulator with XRE-family HTH domain